MKIRYLRIGIAWDIGAADIELHKLVASIERLVADTNQDLAKDYDPFSLDETIVAALHKTVSVARGLVELAQTLRKPFARVEEGAYVRESFVQQVQALLDRFPRKLEGS